MSNKNKTPKNIFALDCGTRVTPFNLKKALRGDNVICRNGNSVSQLNLFTFDDPNLNGLYGVTKNDTDVTGWNESGKFNGSFDDSKWDIFMVYKEKPKKDKKVKKTKNDNKVIRWVNIYKNSEVNGYKYVVSDTFDSKKEAKENVPDYARVDGDYVGTVKIKF